MSDPLNEKEARDASEPPPAAEISAEEKEELRRLDALIIAGRDRPAPAGDLQELRWMLYLTFVLLLSAVGSYLVLPPNDRRVTALMVSIAGAVLSGWGAVRGLLTARRGGIAGVGWLYAGFFGVLSLVFAAMTLGLTGVIQ